LKEPDTLLKHFINLFNYSNWATEQSASQVVKENTGNKRVSELLSHIINSQRIWLNRILRIDPIPDPWEEHSPGRCSELSKQVTSEWINFLESLDYEDLERKIKYKNNKGKDSENTIGDILTHIINHSTYHRGQIAQLLRQSGKQPPKTDYIAYRRALQSQRF
jgi:uncharacterized damage-inducible protein DinB